MTWREQAACLGHDDPSIFDAEGRGQVSTEALRICAGCPVRIDCLQEALDRDTLSDQGIWGGTTPSQRYAVRRRRMDAATAMRRGDALAERRTDVERIVEDEPWLAPVGRVEPVTVHRRRVGGAA